MHFNGLQTALWKTSIIIGSKYRITFFLCEHNIYANMRVKIQSQKYNSHIFMVKIATPHLQPREGI